MGLTTSASTSPPLSDVVVTVNVLVYAAVTVTVTVTVTVHATAFVIVFVCVHGHVIVIVCANVSVYGLGLDSVTVRVYVPVPVLVIVNVFVAVSVKRPAGCLRNRPVKSYNPNVNRADMVSRKEDAMDIGMQIDRLADYAEWNRALIEAKIAAERQLAADVATVPDFMSGRWRRRNGDGFGATRVDTLT